MRNKRNMTKFKNKVDADKFNVFLSALNLLKCTAGVIRWFERLAYFQNILISCNNNVITKCMLNIVWKWKSCRITIRFHVPKNIDISIFRKFGAPHLRCVKLLFVVVLSIALFVASNSTYISCLFVSFSVFS